MKLNIFKIYKSAVFCIFLLVESMLVSAQGSVPQFWQLNNSPDTLIWDNIPWNGKVDNGTGTFTATSVTWAANGGRFNSTINACKNIVFGGNPGVGAAGTVTLNAPLSNIKSISFHPAESGDFTIVSGSITCYTSDLPMSVDNGLSPTVSSVFSGSNSITKNGSGTLVLTGVNTYTGTTNVNDGTLQIGNGGTTGTTGGTGNVYVNAGMLDYYRSADFTTTTTKFFAKTNTVIRKRGAGKMDMGTGAGKFTTDAGATLDIVGGTFYSGGGGTQVYQNNKGSLNVASGAQLDIYGDNGFFDALTGSGTYYNSWKNNDSMRTLTLGISNNVNNVQYGVTNNTAEFSGVITINGYGTSNAGKSYTKLDLYKVGTGTQILSGSNQYHDTYVNGGTLVANNINALGGMPADGSIGTVRVNSGGTLSIGADNIPNPIIVNAGGTLNKNGQFVPNVTNSAGTVNN